MANWKKVIVSGSNASLNHITASGAVSASGNLFASLTTDSSNLNTVMYNTTTGQFFHTGSYNNAATGISNLEASASAGIYFSASVNGGVSIPLMGTASFIGGTGITTTYSSTGKITISSDTGELTSPFQIRTGSSAVGTSIAYGGTASFAAAGAGLTVDETSGTVTYTITPDDVLNGATDTATFNFTSSNAVTASYAGTANNVTIVDNENGGDDRAIVFATPSIGNSQLETDNSSFRYNPSEAKIMIGDTTNITSIDGAGNILQEGNSTTSNIFNTVVTTMNIGGAATSINMGATTGTTNILGSASIAGDLIVNGTTTTLNTQNLLVEDRYILLGSSSAANNVGGGIVVQKATTGIGTALHWDDVKEVWAVDIAGADAQTATAKNVDAVVVFASHSAGTPTGTPLVGAAASPNYRLGQMYLDTANTDADGNTIWIYAT